MKIQKTVVILSISSDIGFYLGKRYLEEGYTVVGTYRHFGKLKELRSFASVHLIKCDISKKTDIKKFVEKFRKLNLRWETFISCVGDLRPLTPFFKSDFDLWFASVRTNSLDQLWLLHDLYPFRNKNISNVVFFAGGGVNNAVVDLSAYTIGKIMLIKMCEFLDAENRDLNIFIVGPGWIKTKIHNAVLTDNDVSKVKYDETVKFLKSGKGAEMEDIYASIRFLCAEGKKVASGRNFAVAYDPLDLRQQKKLSRALRKDKNMYKLRRYKNDFQI